GIGRRIFLTARIRNARTAARHVEEIRMAAGYVLAVEVAVRDGQHQALSASRAALGIRIFHGGAGEARFGLASARATVTVDRVAIVAHFAVGGVDVAVAARRAASHRSAGRIATDGLFGAGLGATGTIAKK